MELYVSLDPFRLNEFVKKSVRCRMGSDFNSGLHPYGVRWRKHRRLLHEYLHANAVYKYIPIQEREVHTFLGRLLVTPDNFFHHIEQ